ncbi:MAG: acyl carrier protein [Clostridia bacterium]|nr:acyl carrier protein [Clostridia bacterium]
MVFEKIREIICELFEIPEEEIKPETTLEDADIDSIDAVELAMNVESEFDIEIPDEELKKMRSVADLVRFVESC